MSTRGWKREEVEKLVTWIVENEPATGDSIATWTKRAKEEALPEDDNIDVKKIKSKFNNTRNSYKTAKEFLSQPGYRVTKEDRRNAIHSEIHMQFPFNISSNEVVEVLKKCAFLASS